jgi:hypothetical protein
MVGSLIGFPLGAILVAGGVPGPAPVTTKYKIETKVQTTIDLSAMGQGTQQQDVIQSAFITIALNDTATGKVVHVVIDSLATDAAIPGAAEAMAKAKGAWLHGLIDSKGKVTVVKTSADSNDFVAELKSSVPTFFPRIRAGAKQGDSWVDTTNLDTRTTSRAVKSTVITTFTHAGADPAAGPNGLRIETIFSSTAAGTVENPMAGTMEMESNDKGTGKFYVGADGRYLGGSSQSEAKATIKSAMGPDPIPLKIIRTSTISVLK